MHVLRLRLKTTETDKKEIDKRFRIVAHLHNVMVKEAIRRLNRLKQDSDYQNAKETYKSVISKQNRTADERRQLSEAKKTMKDCISRYSLKKNDFRFYGNRERKPLPTILWKSRKKTPADDQSPGDEFRI